MGIEKSDQQVENRMKKVNLKTCEFNIKNLEFPPNLFEWTITVVYLDIQKVMYNLGSTAIWEWMPHNFKDKYNENQKDDISID